MAVMRRFINYYGGKWKAAKLYPAPKFDIIVEPFAGAAGYSVRHHSKKVILCDLDPVIVGVWKYLINASRDEILSIPDVPIGGSVEDLRLSEEQKWLVGFWLGAGDTSPRRMPSRWMRDGTRPGGFWGRQVRQRLASQVEFIRHWEIFHCSYDQCPYDGPAAWFIDPPYQIAGRKYKFNSNVIDYQKLGEWSKSRPGQAIACEQEGANWLPFKFLAHCITVQNRKPSKEVVWTSEDYQ
jgi:hypothetical protein